MPEADAADTNARYHHLLHGLAIVDLQRPRDRLLDVLSLYSKRPADAGAAEVEGQAVVSAKVLGLFRCSFALQVGMGRADNAPALAKPAGQQSSVWQVAHPDRDIRLL